MKYELMLNILFCLLARNRVTATYLSERYEISRRTVYRYIECIELAGVPVLKTRGSLGGFEIPSTYKLPASFLTKEELTATINSLKALESDLKMPQINSAIDKITGIAKNMYSGMNFHSGNVIIDSSAWGDTASYRNKIAILEKCIEERISVLLSYHDRGGEMTERVIHPHALVFKQGIWYVYAFCTLRGDFRLFKTARIAYAHLTGEIFQRREFNKDDLPLTFKYANDEVIVVDFEVAKVSLPEVEEWLGVENVQISKEGRIFASAVLPNDKGLIPKILSYGNGLKVLSPDDLKDSLKKAAEEILANYS